MQNQDTLEVEKKDNWKRKDTKPHQGRNFMNIGICVLRALANRTCSGYKHFKAMILKSVKLAESKFDEFLKRWKLNAAKLIFNNFTAQFNLITFRTHMWCTKDVRTTLFDERQTQTDSISFATRALGVPFPRRKVHSHEVVEVTRDGRVLIVRVWEKKWESLRFCFVSCGSALLVHTAEC